MFKKRAWKVGLVLLGAAALLVGVAVVGSAEQKISLVKVELKDFSHLFKIPPKEECPLPEPPPITIGGGSNSSSDEVNPSGAAVPLVAEHWKRERIAEVSVRPLAIPDWWEPPPPPLPVPPDTSVVYLIGRVGGGQGTSGASAESLELYYFDGERFWAYEPVWRVWYGVVDKALISALARIIGDSGMRVMSKVGDVAAVVGAAAVAAVIIMLLL